MSSLRITPAPSHPTSTTKTQTTKGAPSAPGLPDTLRLAQTEPCTSQLSSTHPLESRLSSWQTTQEQLQATIQRRTFGVALPLRIGMERQMVSQADNMRPAMLGRASGVHDDILRGRDATVEWEDIFAGQDGLRDAVNVHGDGSGMGVIEQIERDIGMGKW